MFSLFFIVLGLKGEVMLWSLLSYGLDLLSCLICLIGQSLKASGLIWAGMYMGNLFW